VSRNVRHSLLVGDNPFHNISHLSQERARARTEDPSDPKFAAKLICTAVENGANGFMFSVSGTTLAIIKELGKADFHDVSFGLYAIVPYAYEYSKLATQLGGIPGLAKKVGKEIFMKNILAVGFGIKGMLTMEPEAILKAYLSYEISRVKSRMSRGMVFESVLLHQLITDMALALDLDWLFKSYVNYLEKKHITPGFNTGNFPFLVRKFADWGLDLSKVVIAAPLNKVGFQMIPSIEENENALASLSKPVVIGISILAAGSLGIETAADYVRDLPNIKGVAVGISKEKQAAETFLTLKEMASRPR
jgi:hypothetical protein